MLRASPVKQGRGTDWEDIKKRYKGIFSVQEASQTESQARRNLWPFSQNCQCLGVKSRNLDVFRVDRIDQYA